MSEQTINKVLMANPAPLGLMGFGMTTVLLNLHNTGLFGLGSMILAMGIFYGGMAQVIAGIMEWKNGNTFGTLAFTSFGFFWLSLAGLIVLPMIGITTGNDSSAMASYLFMWGIFTALMFFGTLRTNAALMFVFGSLAILFLLLGLGDLTGNTDITHLAGWEGLAVGFSAMYTAIALVLNESFGRTVLPIFPRKT
ncbi:MAG: acetate uptake transporter [Methanomassiliicoccales archaeon]